jgi:hypothetical membrane protein
VSGGVHDRRPSSEIVSATSGVLAFLAIAGACVCGAIGYTGRAGEAYSPLNHWISELGEPGVAAHADAFNVLLSIGGVLFVGFVLGLWRSSPSRLRWGFGPVGVVAGFAGTFVGQYPMTHPTEHVLAASAFFELGWVFVALASVSFLRARDPRSPPWLAGVGVLAVAASIGFLVSLRVDEFSRQRMASEGPIVGRPDVWMAPILEWATLIGIMAWVLLTSLAWSRQLRCEARTGAVVAGPAA